MLCKTAAALAVLLPVVAIAAETATPPSESDFLADMPIVLSVSRLSQPLDEAPGAVTVLDRDTIHRSGARTMPDLLRLVPGFQVTNAFENSPSIVSYHGGFGDYSNRLQVLIDGRSVYSPFLLGNAGNGLQTVAIDDIERIEVLRGSNSAAYGARAILGVINIVTRDPNDTRGLAASVSHGNNGVADWSARGGWGNDALSLRLSARRSGDEGLVGPLGHWMDPATNTGLSAPDGANHLEIANLRVDFRASERDSIELRAGATTLYSGTGNLFAVGNPVREKRNQTRYLQADWKRVLGPDSDLAVSLSHSEEVPRDNFNYKLPAPFFGTVVDFGGEAANDVLTLAHTLRLDPSLRLVWGGELRREEVRSQQLYGVPQLATNFARLFGNLEWRLSPTLLANAGALEEHSSLSGDSLAPRLMLNWHLAPGHTLRLGASRAHRPPSLYEAKSNTQYIVNGVLLDETYVSRSVPQPETVLSREIGYLGEIRPLHLTIDLRLFNERVEHMIRAQAYALPPHTKLLGSQTAQEYLNDPIATSIKGGEFQLKMAPWSGAQLTYNYTHTDIDSPDIGTAQSAPRDAKMLMLMQRLPRELDLSLIHHLQDAMTWQKGGNVLAGWSRTDLRLAYPFALGGHRGELAWVVQNLGGHRYNDYNNHFYFPRLVFTTVSMRL